MSTRLLFGLTIIAATLAGCDGGGSFDLPPAVQNADPAPPALGTQVDRMGRAAIATALVSPLADDMTRGAALDAYNAAQMADWPGFADQIRASLGAYDGLDAMCGNQILADMSAMGPERYDAFTGALVDDRLYVNASSGACSQYLAVELDATGLAANDDCGGRTPLYDTIDVSYTALSNDLTIPVGDGVASDTVAHSLNLFPFFAPADPPPPPPPLGTQVDRMGRAAIATALISPIADDATRGADLDAYNAAERPDWGTFTTNIRTHLAIFDGLDTVCGNQVLANATAAGPERYDTFAGALADDRLYVNTASGSCGQYLAVELNATGLVPNADCGGRTPRYDTVDVSYTALSNDLSLAVGDGVDADNVLHFTTGFPFFAAP